MRQIRIDRIKPNPDQPRKFIDKKSLKELAESISKNGLLEAILIRPLDNNFQIVHGERRWRACKLLKRKTIKAEVRKLSDEEAFNLSLIENLQRENLNLEDEARAIKKLKDTGITETQVGKKIGKTRDYIAKKLLYLRDLDRLDDFVKKKIVSKDEAEKFKADVRCRTISPDVLREAVKTDWRYRTEAILAESPTVQKARDITYKAERKIEERNHKEFDQKIWENEEFKKVYIKERRKYVNLLSEKDRNKFDYILTTLRAIFMTLSHKKIKFREKWTEKFCSHRWELLWICQENDESKINDWLDWYNTYNLWIGKKPSIKELADNILIKLKNLVEMDKTKRKALFEKFDKEWEKITQESEEDNTGSIFKVLYIFEELPEEIWKKIHRCLALNFHPDKGGDLEISKWVNKLNDGMKNLYEKNKGG